MAESTGRVPPWRLGIPPSETTAEKEGAMARAKQRPEREERRKRPILIVLFSLFPLLAAVGAFAPGMISVMAEEDNGYDESPGRVTQRLSRYAHQPLLLPRDFSIGFAPELVFDLEHLMARQEIIGDSRSQRRPRLPSFPRNFGDVIVLDDVDQRIREIVFKDPVLVALSASTKLPPPAADLTPLGGASPIGPGPRFDDYLGPNVDVGNVVPEPSTGLLLGMGLIAIGLGRRYRQPIGS